MDKYSIVPMNLGPQQFSMGGRTTIDGSEIPSHIYNALVEEKYRLRNQNDFNGLGFTPSIVSNDVGARLRNTDPYAWYVPEAGTFTQDEVNRILADKYQADMYSLAQNKNRYMQKQKLLQQNQDKSQS